MELSAYILMAMLYFSPLHKNVLTEDPDKRLNRYQDISKDISEVAMDPDEEPVFKGSYAREKTALLLASVAKHESNYDHNVEIGKKKGPYGSICLMQVIPNMKNTNFNYSKDFLLADRKNCIRAALNMIRNNKCSESLNDMMRSYVSGRCSKHPDPKVERKISIYAYGEVYWYLNFSQLYPVKNYVTLSLSK